MGSVLNFGSIEIKELNLDDGSVSKKLNYQNKVLQKSSDLNSELLNHINPLTNTERESNLDYRRIKQITAQEPLLPEFDSVPILKVPIKIRDNKISFKISYYDLPLSFQKELKNEMSNQATVLHIILLKIILSSFEISDQGIPEVKELLTHLHLFPLQILDLTYKYYKLSQMSDSLIYEFLKSSLDHLLIDINHAMPLVSEKSQEHLRRIYNLIFDLNESYEPNKKPLFFNVKLTQISELYSIDVSEPMDRAILELQKRVNLVLKFFTYIYKTILIDNKVFFAKYPEDKDIWQNSDNLYKKLKKYILLKRKKEITFINFEQILEKLATEVSPFIPTSQIFHSKSDPDLYNDIPKKPILNYEKYSYVKSNEKTITLDKDFLSNFYTYDTSLIFIPDCVNNILEKTLILGNIYCHNKKLKISTEAMNSLFSKLKSFLEKMNKINISFKINVITEKGVESANYIFNLLDNIVNELDQSWKVYNLNGSQFCIGLIYKHLYCFKNQINNHLFLFLKILSEETASQKKKIDFFKRKSKLQLNREKLIFERSLLNIYLFKELLEQDFYPLENIINNFEKTFLIQEKIDFSREIPQKTTIPNKSINIKNDQAINVSEKNEGIVEEIIKEEDSFKNEKLILNAEKLSKNEISVKTECSKKMRAKARKKQRQKETEKLNEVVSIEVKEDFNSKIELLNHSLAEKNNHQSLRNVKFLDLIQEVVDHGFLFLKQTGSHVNFKNPEHPELGIVTVPRHNVISKGVVKEVRTKINKK